MMNSEGCLQSFFSHLVVVHRSSLNQEGLRIEKMFYETRGADTRIVQMRWLQLPLDGAITTNQFPSLRSTAAATIITS